MSAQPVFLIPHTHWDREWYLPFEEFRHRLVGTVDEVLATLESDAAWVFTLDGQAVALEDYLEVRPDQRERVRALVAAGRLGIGPLYVLPDEWLCSGEAAVRNLVLGMETCAALGGSLDVGYLPDMFGHVAQMPQLLRRAGLEVAVLWRGVDPPEQGLFRWRAPDGSEVTTRYLASGYGDVVHVPEDAAALRGCLAQALAAQDPYRGPGPDVLMVGTDHRPITPTLLAGLRAMGGGDAEASGYRMGTWSDYFHAARPEVSVADLPRVEGELRDARRAHVLPGTLSSRHWVKQAHVACERDLLEVMDPCLAWALEAGVLPREGRAQRLLGARAWKLHLQNLAHDTICGCSVDAVHEEGRVRSRKAGELARALGREALQALAPRDPGGTAPLVVTRVAPGPETSVEVSFEVDPEERTPALRLGERPLETVAVGRRPGRVLREEGAGPEVLEAALRRTCWGQCGEFMVRAVEPEPGEVPTLRFRLTRHVEIQPDYAPLWRWVRALPRGGPARVEYREPSEVTVRTWLPASSRLGIEGVAFDEARDAVEAGPWIEPHRAHPDPVRLGERTLLVDPQDGSLTLEGPGYRFEGLLGIRDVGDRGDEYTHDPVGDTTRPAVELLRTATRTLGPRAVEVEVARQVSLPVGLAPQRGSREARTVACEMVTTIRMEVGSPVLDCRVHFQNRARDHHLSLRVPTGAAASTVRAGQPFAEVERPVALPRAEGWLETPMPFFPFQGWFAAAAGAHVLTVLCDQVFEHGAWEEPGGLVLGLTLVRGTEWLSRDDLRTRARHAGPPLPTPGAQELGAHEVHFGLAVTGPGEVSGWELHQGWSRRPRLHDLGGTRRLGPALGLEVEAPGLVVSSLAADPDPACAGLLLRVFHPGGEGPRRLRVGGAAAAEVVDLRGEVAASLPARAGAHEVDLAPYEILTLRLRAPAPAPPRPPRAAP